MTTKTEREFFDEGVQVGSVFIMKPSVAIRFIEICRESGFAVYGVEGFIRIGDRIQPQQEHSCDYESPTDDGHTLTIGFLNDRLLTNLWFEVVTDEQPEI